MFERKHNKGWVDGIDRAETINDLEEISQGIEFLKSMEEWLRRKIEKTNW